MDGLMNLYGVRDSHGYWFVHFHSIRSRDLHGVRFWDLVVNRVWNQLGHWFGNLNGIWFLDLDRVRLRDLHWNSSGHIYRNLLLHTNRNPLDNLDWDWVWHWDWDVSGDCLHSDGTFFDLDSAEKGLQAVETSREAAEVTVSVRAVAAVCRVLETARAVARGVCCRYDRSPCLQVAVDSSVETVTVVGDTEVLGRIAVVHLQWDCPGKSVRGPKDGIRVQTSLMSFGVFIDF